MKGNFLLEIGTEELPAGWLAKGTGELKDKICNLLSSYGLSYSQIIQFYTPRRLAILVKAIDTKQQDKYIEITGPPRESALTKDGAWSTAAIGFARAHNVSLKALKLKKKGKKEVVFCKKLIKGKTVVEILSSNLPIIISQLEFPKSMRWEETGFKFARPIRWIVALIDKEVIPFEIAGVKSGKKSKGLRFTPGINIENASFYQEVMRKNGVIVDFQERLEMIKKGIQEVEKKFSLIMEPDESLLIEVTNLVEYPSIIIGKFETKYLSLPKEVIIAGLRTHQRYFALSKKGDKLAPFFIVVANTRGGNIDKIREGHERVIRARLEDAEFYYKEDIKIPMEERIKELKEITWQEGLGTLYEKSNRLIQLSQYIIKYIPFIDFSLLKKAITLCKVDLVTNMIKDGKEFTKLQGLYGSILAREQKLEPEVVTAIRKYSSSQLPTLPNDASAVALGVVDRIDTIVGAFIIEKIPTGTKDPLAIRRLSDELIAIIINNKLHMSIKELVKRSLETYKVKKNIGVYEFLRHRLGRYLIDKGIRYDIVNAVLELENEDFLDLYLRALSLEELKKKEEFITLVILAKRVRNILKSSKNKISKCDSKLFQELEEKRLHKALLSGEKEFRHYISQREYKKALYWLLNLAPLINNLFDKVLIMEKNVKVRENRIALLYYLHSFFQSIAEFSKIAE